MSKHIVLDLETLGTNPGCVVFAIGAVAFDTEVDTPGNFSNQFHSAVSIMDAIEQGFTISSSTLNFWRNKYSVEYELACKLSVGISPEKACNSFNNWYQNFSLHGKEKVYVWGNGNEFDNAILKNYFEQCGVDLPWTFREDMDFRTVKLLFPQCKPNEDNKDPHNSLADAKYEGEWLQNILRHIEK